MKHYLANILSISRGLIVFGLLYFHGDLYSGVRFVMPLPFLTWIFLGIVSDALDGMVAKRFGSTPIGANIDFFVDRFCMVVLYHAVFPMSLRFAYLTLCEIMMIFWKVCYLWPNGDVGAAILHPLFPRHLGRVSIVLRAIGGFILCTSRFYSSFSWLKILGNLLLWPGSFIATIAIIIYPIMMLRRRHLVLCINLDSVRMKNE